MKITVIATGFDSTRQTLREFVAPPAQQYSGSSSFGQSNQQEQQQDQNQTQTDPTQNQNQNPPLQSNTSNPTEDNDEEVWDIPAFLRQKN